MVEYRQMRGTAPATVWAAWDGDELVGTIVITDQDWAMHGALAIRHRVAKWKLWSEAERRRFHWDAAERLKRRTLNLWG